MKPHIVYDCSESIEVRRTDSGELFIFDLETKQEICIGFMDHPDAVQLASNIVQALSCIIDSAREAA